MLNTFSSLMVYQDLALFIVRLISGIAMVYYGLPKIKGLKENAAWFTKIGFRPGIFWGTIVALVEFFGGIVMILGILVPLAATLFGFQMIVGAIWKIKGAQKPFSDYSYDLLLLALMLTLLTFGSGTYVISFFFN